MQLRYRYLLDFDSKGQRKKTEIDFDLMGKHILTLEKNARKQGIKIKKIIFKIDLKDELFASQYGAELKSSGIYFAQQLTPLLNKLHDDHYHIDFVGIK